MIAIAITLGLAGLAAVCTAAARWAPFLGPAYRRDLKVVSWCCLAFAVSRLVEFVL